MTPLLELRDVHKIFHGRGRSVAASRGVSLAVQPGEVVGLVGESGSGKSTVANLALGLLEPDSGEVLVHGERLIGASRRREKELRARVQAVFQEPLLALDGRRTIGWSRPTAASSRRASPICSRPWASTRRSPSASPARCPAVSCSA